MLTTWMEAEPSRERRCDKIVEEGPGDSLKGTEDQNKSGTLEGSNGVKVLGKTRLGERGGTRFTPLFGDPLQNP